MSLYNQFRPQTLDEIFGQDEAVSLMKAILAQPHDKRPKVFLLGGTYGCGKTTMAMVFARAIGCDPDSMDFRIVDASKDRSIDNIRMETEKMGTYPMNRRAEARVWCFDECHSLLKPAAEALLKKCEDVPACTYIFFCTTEPDALGKALRSRCKVITINPLTAKALFQNLKYVAAKAEITAEEDDLKKIAMNSDQSARVSLQILENYHLNGGDVDKAIAMNAGAGEKLKADTYTLCKAIINRGAPWEMAVSFCKTYTGQSEPVRQCILGYLKACLLNSRTPAERTRFVSLMQCFLEPHFYNGDAGMVYQLACAWEVK